MSTFNLEDCVKWCGSDMHCKKCSKHLKYKTKYNVRRHYAVVHGEMFGEQGTFSGKVGLKRKKERNMETVPSAVNFGNDSQFKNKIANSRPSSSQPTTIAEQPNESTVNQMSSRDETENGFFAVGTVREEFSASTQIPSQFKNPIQNNSYIPKQMETLPAVDDEMKNFVKSYGMAISKGLEALPADVAIEFSLKVLKEINEKILEIKFERKFKNGNENDHDSYSVSEKNEIIEPDNLNSDAEMGGSQGEMSAEKPDGVTDVQESTREKSNIASFAIKTKSPVSTQVLNNYDASNRQENTSKLKKPPQNQPSTEKDKDMIIAADDEMQNFVKSYGLTISRGLETLPGDVTIGVAINVLKELNHKVLETKFKRKRSDDNKSIHSWRSVSDETANNDPNNSDTEMDDCNQVEVLSKDNGNNPNNLFLDIPIKIEPDVM